MGVALTSARPSAYAPWVPPRARLELAMTTAEDERRRMP
jgi:hypothetical protein